MTTLTVRGACPHDCPDTCAVLTTVQDGKAIDFQADPDHPYTQGWLCAKVRPYLDHVYHPDRLRWPLRRVGPKGRPAQRWERIGWDEAIATIVGRWSEIIARHGAAAILPYSYSGTLGLVQLSVCNTRLWNRMGASALRRSICGAAAEAAVTATVGGRFAPDPEDMLQSKLIILWGHNPASTGPHAMPLLRRAQRAGARIVVIDPKRTTTARSADQHIQPRPATDGALALGLMHVLFEEGLHDEPWLRLHSVGWEALRDRAMEYSPEHVETITGVQAEVIRNLARAYGMTKPALLKFADGVQRHGNGGQTARALACLPAIVGQLGVRGGGLFYSTSDYVRWDAATVGHAHECVPAPRTVNMNRLGAALLGEVEGPPIASLYVFCANPAASSPNAGLIARGLAREDLFTVVHDLFMTDTATHADIVLPATSQLEHVDLHKPYGQRTLQYNNPAIAPLDEAKSNWDVMRLLAEGMGYGEPWLREDAESVIRTVLEATRPTHPSLQDVAFDRLQRDGTISLYNSADQQVPFADGRFPTPSGKVELWCEAMVAQGLDPLPSYEEPTEFRREKRGAGRENSLVLISSASHHFVSSSLANQASLRAKEGPPSIEMHPYDARMRGIVDGASVVVENERGSCMLRAVVTDDVMAGVVVATKGQWAMNSPEGCNVNWTTSDALGDLAGQSTFHSNLVTIRPA